MRRLDPASEAAAEGARRAAAATTLVMRAAAMAAAAAAAAAARACTTSLAGATRRPTRYACRLRAALRWHPDRHSGGDDEARELAELNFKRINRAHAILADAGCRRQFDLGARAQDLA